MKKLFSILVSLALAAVPALSLAETSFDGSVVASGSVSVTAPFGGTVSACGLRAGSKIAVGDPIVTIETTKVYATSDGTVTGVFGQVGDSVEDVTSRYGAVLYIVPTHKYSITADIEKAYNSSDMKYVNIGETVYISCTSDGSHTAVGYVTSASGTTYTVETTSGELIMEETVNIYRSAEYTSKSRIGRGTVSRTPEIAVTGSGSILFLHVTDGQTVERGDLLMETVTGSFDGLYATSNQIVSGVSGVIASVDVSAGQTVGKGDTLLTVYPEDSLQIEISVDEYDLASLSEGDTLSLAFNYDEDKSETLTGTVAMISHVSSAQSDGEASYSAYVDFTPTASVRLGMTVVATLDTAQPAAADVEAPEDVGASLEEAVAK